MPSLKEIYNCELCGNIAEIITAGTGALVCCGAPMELLEEKTADKTLEKHVPIIEKFDGGYKVTVGSTPHPMEDKHHIKWIELIADNKAYRQYLKPGGKAEAFFVVEAHNVSAREYCNIHGLWKG
jgi:superoxide reductase